jgi:ElaB/YqjD/DUF883 family membrane-anchored ribosome-binding protein
MYKYYLITLLLFSLILSSCSKNGNREPVIYKPLDIKMDKIAENYVKLVLNVGLYDPDFVDAYYGPKEWIPQKDSAVVGDSATIQNLYSDTDKLLDSLESISNEKASDIQVLRYKYLYKQLLAVKTKLFMIAGGKLSFDEETKALYDAEAPHYDNTHFQKILDQLNKILPGKGNDIEKRLENFKKQFIIPKDKLSEVFNAAIQEARKRTLEHIKLPKNESFKVEYVNNKPWDAYNWYKGNSYSIIQVNTDLPIYIDRAIDIACHEGYPGHHVYNTLIEQRLYKKLGWVEFSIYALFSPQSLIAEGTANYGIDVAFPGRSRMVFEKSVLFRLAGLHPSDADKYYEVLKLTKKLDYATNEAARNYLDGKWTKKETINWLIKYSLKTPANAEKTISFIEKYRSYVINYNLGKDIVADYINRVGGVSENPELRWKIFKHILTTPQTASNLQKGKMSYRDIEP